MTLATRCPACGTVFRVVQDQLRVSQGWVRCGRCSEAFNALESMVDSPSVAMPESPPAGRSGSASPPGMLAPGADRTDSAAASAETPGPNDGQGPPAPEPKSIVEPPAAVQADAPTNLLETPAATPMIEVPEGLALIASDGGIGAQALLARHETERVEPSFESGDALPAGEVEPPTPQAWSVDEPVVVTAIAPAEALHQVDDEADAVQSRAPSFLVQAERAERWRRPGVRVALGLLATIGVLGLTGQAVYALRDRAAATFPVLRPVLRQACSAWGCRIDDLRQIEALSVESSGLVRVEGAPVYRLSVTLRNRAAVEVAAPALDLTLTDAQGRQIARRVLQMSDLHLPLRTLKPGSELPIQVPLGVAGSAVSGYTVEIFYP